MGEILLDLLVNKKKRSATSSDSDGDTSSGIESDTNTMGDYLDFIKIQPAKRQSILNTLEDNDIDSFKLFKSKNITCDHMSKWGLSDGIIAQLRDNVSRYECHLHKK